MFQRVALLSHAAPLTEGLLLSLSRDLCYRLYLTFCVCVSFVKCYIIYFRGNGLEAMNDIGFVILHDSDLLIIY